MSGAEKLCGKKIAGIDINVFEPGAKIQVAEGVGFEPTVPLQARRFSRPVP